jgi:serine/threonine protein kinase
MKKEYVKKEKLGEGGFGRVYRGLSSAGKEVALKEIYLRN